MFLLIILYMLFASTFTIGKAALEYTTPILFIGMRMAVGGLLLLIYQYITDKSKLSFHMKDIGVLAQISFFQYYAAFILEFMSLQWVTSSKACLLFNFSPFITAVLSFFLLGEYLTQKKILGLVVGFFGLLPIFMATASKEELAGSIAWLSLPEIMLLGAVVSASYGWIILKKAQESGYSTIVINAYTMTSAGLVALLSSFIFEGQPTILPPETCLGKTIPWLCQILGTHYAGIAMFVLYTFILIFISNIVCFNLYGYLLKRYTATFVSFAGFITPLFTAFFGWLFLSEHIGWPFIASLLIVFLGLFLFFQDELKAKV